MATNFDFLKSTDKNLLDIITEAEKLYRDEYFEQCMGQTRRFGEHVCKDVLGNHRTTEETFDEMLSTLKDKSKGNPQEKEFLADVDFLKKNGKKSVHGATVKKDGLVALECLQRAFEVAISYSVFKNGPSDKLMRLQYDTELMLTGKKNKSLSERYSQAKIKAQKTKKIEEKTEKISKKTPAKKQTKKYKIQKEKVSKVSIFWIIMLIAFTMSLTTIGLLMLSTVKP